jgi:hypothetical protein
LVGAVAVYASGVTVPVNLVATPAGLGALEKPGAAAETFTVTVKVAAATVMPKPVVFCADQFKVDEFWVSRPKTTEFAVVVVV